MHGEDESAVNTGIGEIICSLMNVPHSKIGDISMLKNGMTNKTYLFSCKGEKYIIRVPGEGTECLVNRGQEAENYRVLSGLGICDDVIYINSRNGIKIARYLEPARVCNAGDEEDVKKCMEKLRAFHELKLTVDHEFDLFERINFYEDLWRGKVPGYTDYSHTKKNIVSLKPFIDGNISGKVLTHIDAVPDNFLFYMGKDKGREDQLFLIDWEYAGMGDPHMDVAMFCIYSSYNREQTDWLVRTYFGGRCPVNLKIKIYCYMAAGGLLWSNWCEYKRSLGVEFGKYAERQYQYAREYYIYAREELDKIHGGKDA